MENQLPLVRFIYAVNQRANLALHPTGDGVWAYIELFFKVPAQAPALFSASPRSAKVDVPRRVNAHIVRRTQAS